MKVLHVAETAKGGVGTYLNEILALQTAALGAEAVRVIVPADHAGQITHAVAGQVVGFRRTVRSAGGLWRLGVALRQVVRAWPPDVIHAHSTFAGVVVRAMYGWRRRRPAIVYCPHGWAFDMRIAGWKRAILAGCEALLSRLGDHVVAISQHEAQAASRIGIKPGLVTTIYNGLPALPPAAAEVAWRDAQRKILFVGRLDRQKGFDLVAAAVAGLEDRVAVRVAGAAVVTDVARPEAAHIHYLGWLDAAGIEGQLRQADLLVMPSRWEGLGLTALEAMRAGKPVVATAVGGLKEVVQDGVSGRLVPADDVAALRTALLADDDATLRAMGAAGRVRFLQDFTSDRMHRRLLELYGSLLQRTVLAGAEAHEIVPVAKILADRHAS